MPNYQDYVMRHGEAGVLYIIEQIERLEGIRHIHLPSLEERWHALDIPAGSMERRLAA